MTILLRLIVSGAITGSGDLVAGASTVAGVGISRSTGTGALAAQAAQIIGVGISRSTGTGALLASASTIAGTGTATSNTIIGSGALAAQAAHVSGAGISRSTGTGSLLASATSIAGLGASRSTGTGALAAQASHIAGTGIAKWVAYDGRTYLLENGTDHYLTEAGTARYALEEVALHAGLSQISGVGISRSAGTGALLAQSSTLIGSDVTPDAASLTVSGHDVYDRYPVAGVSEPYHVSHRTD